MTLKVSDGSRRISTDRVYRNGFEDGREDRRKRRKARFSGPEDRGPYKASTEYRRGYWDGYGR